VKVNLPLQADVERELLLLLRLQRRPMMAKRAYTELAELMQVTREQRSVTDKTLGGREYDWPWLVRQARRKLVDKGDIVPRNRAERGEWALTETGRHHADNLSKVRAGTLSIDDLGF
jgi:hypothetical protein